MYPNQEIKKLRKSGQINEAYRRGYELLEENPKDQYLAGAIGWVIYDKVKNLVEEAKQNRNSDKSVDLSQLQKLLREYAKLQLTRPDLLFSLLLSQTIRFPEKLEFLPKFVKWAGVDSFRTEDFQAQTGNDGKKFDSLVEKTAREVGKLTRDLNSNSENDIEARELQEFAISLIDIAISKTEVQQIEWLYYNKALLLNQLGKSEEAQKFLIPVVQEKRDQYWAWHALANVVENSDSQLALSLCCKSYLTCKDLKFAVRVFEDITRLALQQNNLQLARWATDQAFTIRNDKSWRITQSLRDFLESNWYSQAGVLLNPEESLKTIAEDAEKVTWGNLPRYQANYLGTFNTKKGKTMVKFGLLWKGLSQEIANPVRGLLDNIKLDFGEPVTVAVDERDDRATVVFVEKRISGSLFDSMAHKTGKLRLTSRGFGFVDDVFVPPEIASQLEDQEVVSVVTVKKFDKKKNQWGMSAIAILDH